MDKESKWFSKAVDPEDLNGSLAVNRLNLPIVKMFPDTGGPLAKESSFFMLGSCFARGLERSLLNRGFDVRSYSDDFSLWRVINDNVKAIGATNRYNTGSIMNDFRWSYD